MRCIYARLGAQFCCVKQLIRLCLASDRRHTHNMQKTAHMDLFERQCQISTGKIILPISGQSGAPGASRTGIAGLKDPVLATFAGLPPLQSTARLPPAAAARSPKSYAPSRGIPAVVGPARPGRATVSPRSSRQISERSKIGGRPAEIPPAARPLYRHLCA